MEVLRKFRRIQKISSHDDINYFIFDLLYYGLYLSKKKYFISPW
jgi:ATP-dependent DNA ligase